MARVAEIDIIIQSVAKIWNRLVVFFWKVICQVIFYEQFSNRFAALVINKQKLFGLCPVLKCKLKL